MSRRQTITYKLRELVIRDKREGDSYQNIAKKKN